ncbi:MAG TPA: protein-disulfide reductase DsbD family protein [Flavobacteriales bacterium]|nr:hypothetical protein [Flavobacteriales bacterium]MCB0788793.1 hypothetical protein [Flavobacteriales bacterium]MCB0817841.1 hypothetical protein [Flavobacteriales bacterium]MCB9181092.1 hypothetical protein [Flavobacteriales bacterium]MCB9199120.1 hypothetical protein [Flavobacteriales bacterium]
MKCCAPFIATVLMIGLGVLQATAQRPVQWTFSAVGNEAGALVTARALVDAGWHIYATELPQDGGPLPTIFQVEPEDSVLWNGTVLEPDPEDVYDPNFGMPVSYHSGEVVFRIPVDHEGGGAFTVAGVVEFMVCNEEMCLPPTTVPFRVAVPAL